MKKLIASIASIAVLGLGSTQAAQMQRVTFESNGQTLVGNLYLPDNYQENQQIPGVVVTGSWTSVKEQMAGTYAAQLADKGYAALAFDFRGWGESKDPVMFVENPQRKTEDVIAAAQFLTTRPEVNAGKVAGVGVCASAGYMAGAALQSEALQSIALVAPWLHDEEIVDAVYGGKEGVQSLIAASRQAEANFQATGKSTVVLAASNTDETAIMHKAPYYTETDRGLIPEYDNKFNITSWEHWLTYDAIQTADHLKKPTLLVHSEAAAIPQGVKKFADRMGLNAVAVWLENVTQFDFYDNQKYITHAVNEVDQHFKTTLR